jgi:hypothetical protein|tara:strand:+ start:774 stop:968 length:195 start_codon:yes stop_codon:yes gene_type:complete
MDVNVNAEMMNKPGSGTTPSLFPLFVKVPNASIAIAYTPTLPHVPLKNANAAEYVNSTLPMYTT